MDNSGLVESVPENNHVRRFVDRYQYFDIEEPFFMKAVPNGKIECWILLDGLFEIYDPEKGLFYEAKGEGFFPMGNSTSVYNVPEKITCLNIKLNPVIMGLPFFNGFAKNWKEASVEAFLGNNELKTMRSTRLVENGQLNVPFLDEIMKPILNTDDHLSRLFDLIDLIQKDSGEFKIHQLADRVNMSIKTLERFTRKHFGLSPKYLWTVMRFEQTTSFLKKNETQKFIDALAFGYYDQSHFIKECRKITGYSPGEFFSKLRLSTNDLIFLS